MPTHYAAAISVHLESCKQCQENARKLQGIGGASLEKVEPSSVSNTLKAKLFEKLDAPQANATRANATRANATRDKSEAETAIEEPA